jgi:hypothetical protein
MPDQPPKPTPPAFQVAATPAPVGAAPTVPNGVVMPDPFDPPLAALVEGARADLARRRSVVLADVAVVEVRSVTWPDPGLGCPKPGMAYRQVPVDGLLIRLSVAGIVFNYHSGGGKPPFLCEQPAQGSPPAPAPGLDQ